MISITDALQVLWVKVWIWVRTITQTQHQQRTTKLCEWWFTSAVSREDVLRRGRGDLHQQGDADRDAVYSWGTVVLILRIRIVWCWRYLLCSLYQTCLVRDSAQCRHSDILNSSTVSKAIRHVTILSESLEHGLSACQVPTWIRLFPTEIFPPQSRHSSHQSLWSPYFLWIISLLLLQISTMSCS